jgi:hypothetical protein
MFLLGAVAATSDSTSNRVRSLRLAANTAPPILKKSGSSLSAAALKQGVTD